MEAKTAEKAEKRYQKQTARETKSHRLMLTILYDELKKQSQANIWSDMQVEFGHEAKMQLQYYPDIWVKIGQKEIALSVVTDVNPQGDEKLAKTIEQRHKYFEKHGMKPLWFVEMKEHAIEKDKRAIVLWDAESVISLKTDEDKNWDAFLQPIVKDRSFFHVFNYAPSMDKIHVDVKSMYYIYSTDENVVIKVQRFVSDRKQKPFRAFLLNEGYEIPFGSALYRFQLSKAETEEQLRRHFLTEYENLRSKYEEKERIKEQQERERAEKQKTFYERWEAPRQTAATMNQKRRGVCVFCGTYTDDWWSFIGENGTCKCNPCLRKGKH